LVLIAVFAGYTASFLCVVLERRREGRRPDGRSRCVCGRQIPFARNIPVVTWVLQRGRAHCCGAPIPRWYVVVEALTVAAALAGAMLTRRQPWLGGLIGVATSVLLSSWWHAREM
jgi:prepilin signal peptidase PulO-like enzyme (type II secretory pathway)